MMSDVDPSPEPDAVASDRTGTRVRRRALLGGVVGAAAAGVVGYRVGTASADDGGSDATPPADAASVAVDPTGELVAEDVQSALVDVYERTTATVRLTDLKVALELVDDFAPTANPAPGKLGWFTEAAGPGAGLVQQPTEGGVVQLSTGTAGGGRSAIHLGLDQHTGAPVFTMSWRVRVDRAEGSDVTVAFGAVAAIDDPTGVGPATGMWFAYDPGASDTWWCRCAADGKVTEVDTGRPVNSQPHRFTITSDGAGLVRFWYDDAEVASISDTVPGDEDHYGQGLVIASGGVDVGVVDVDWFYLRRELPR